MDKVYVVTSGEYSEYRIDGIFDNIEDAEKLRDHVLGKIEEYELNPVVPYKDGNMYYCRYDLYSMKVHCVRRVENTIDPTKFGLAFNGLALDRFILADNEEHAEKIFTENVRSFLAGQTIVTTTKHTAVACGDMYKHSVRFWFTQELMWQNGELVVVHDDERERRKEALEKFERGER